MSSEVLEDIIDIKLKMIEIFEKQIDLLKNNKINKLPELQNIEADLLGMLTNKRNLIKKNKDIITECSNEKIIDQLKNACIQFEKTLAIKHEELEKSSFINGKILECITKAIKKIDYSGSYNKMGTQFSQAVMPAIVNRKI